MLWLRYNIVNILFSYTHKCIVLMYIKYITLTAKLEMLEFLAPNVQTKIVT